MLQLNYIGTHFRETKDFAIDRPEGSRDYLFILFHTAIDITLDQQMASYEPGTMILYTPDCPQYYCNKNKGFDNDWFHFTDPDFLDFYQGLGLPVNTPFTLKQHHLIHQHLLSMEEEALMKAFGYDQRLHYMAHSFFILLARLYHKATIYADTPHYFSLEDQFLQLRAKVLMQLAYPWTVIEMADNVSLSRSRFSHLYQLFFKKSPKEDLMTERMSTATHLLINTNLSVAQIGQRVGYDNLYHFSKQFKKAYGLAPLQYRNRLI